MPIGQKNLLVFCLLKTEVIIYMLSKFQEENFKFCYDLKPCSENIFAGSPIFFQEQEIVSSFSASYCLSFNICQDLKL